VRIEIFPRAEADIIRQFRFYLVEQDEPQTAMRFRDAVRECLEHLKPYPHIGSVCHGSIKGLRSWPVKGFEAIRIYYLEVPGVLRVVRILHGKRNVRRILKQESLSQD
jgi:plasmid stabilization system protein ParE